MINAMNTGIIDKLALFEKMQQQEINEILSLMQVMHFPNQRVIFEQGDIAQSLYVLVDGQVIIRYKPYDGPELTVARIAPGGVFGWSAALKRPSYTSSAIAIENSEALKISSDNLFTLCKQHPKTGAIFIERLSAEISNRLQNTQQEVFSILSKSMGMETQNMIPISNKI
jgi:CRP-like cAMP-binding protein